MTRKLKVPKPVTIDFETHGIEGRPKYPPIPVGVSIKYPGKKAKYWAWGHPTGNNCNFGEAKAELAKAWAHKDGILCQNAKFDVDVAECHFDFKPLPWDKVHDTLFLLFLDDPHQIELGLKPSAERLLGLPPEEQDAVGEWLIANQPVPGVRISRSKQSDHYFGRYIALAPGDLVGKYANGDVERTEAIFQLLWQKTADREMLVPYDRERKLAPILLRMERRGVPVDHKRLRADVDNYNEWRTKLDAWIIKTIKAPADINLDSGAQLVEAMVNAGKANPELMPRTATGKFQTNKEALLLGVTDKVLLAVLKYRTQLKTCLGTFMEPWLATADASGGLIYTTWNQTKSTESGGAVGTRTGRLSSTPNFQNIPKEFNPIFAHDETDPVKAKKLPKCPFKDLPPLPLVRSYVVPFKGHVFVDRDYSQQEPRILAHFDGGQLMDTYLANPWVDFHDYAKAELEKMGKFYERKPVKNTNLGLIYGMGVGKLAMKNDMSVEEAGELKKAILVLYPGLKAMYQDMKVRAKSKQPIRTWGGREYYCEEPKLIDGRIREFDYKLVNVLIQGSAADCTKEALIRAQEAFEAAGHADDWFILLNVHDQVTASVPRKDMKEAMEMLRVHMESVEFDVPILSEGAVSATNWAELKDYDKKGKIL
jgi:DNA polymerase I-like protein with 3'-5' exonuclease and polymerase domains